MKYNLQLFRVVVKTLLISLTVMSLFESANTQTDVLPSSNSFVPSWVKDAVFYQIFPDRFANGDQRNDPPRTEPWGAEPTSRNYFGGDLQGIIDKLDYIQSLGANCLYLTPIFWSTSNHKYHTKDYRKVDPHFGDEETFRRLVDECHRRAIRVILDGVFNHTGTDFFAFEDCKKLGKSSKYVKWYNIHSFPVKPPATPNYECWWNLGDLPKLMTHNPEVKDYLFKTTEYWLKLGIDGWRLDVPNEIPHPFWIQWRRLVKKLNPDAYIVGEIWDDASPWLKGDQFDAVMNYRFRKACLDFFVNESIKPSKFNKELRSTLEAYPSDVTFALQNLLGSHDTERFLTLCGGDKQKMKLAWLFQMTYIGAPMIYYGDEVGMTGGKDPECRKPMVWDEAKHDGDLLATMRGLTTARKRWEALRRGSYEEFLVDDKKSLMGFLRRSHGDRQIAVVVLNNGSSPQQVDLKNYTWFGGRNWTQEVPQDLSMGMRPMAFMGDFTLQTKSGIVFIGERRE